MKGRYMFPAIFNEEDGGYNISFPDLKGVYTCGDDFNDSMYMAKDCLETYLYDLEEIPKASDPKTFDLKEGEFIVLVEADLLAFRRKYDTKTVNKNLTIPNWLNEEAKKCKINFSAVLKKALLKELNIQE